MAALPHRQLDQGQRVRIQQHERRHAISLALSDHQILSPHITSTFRTARTGEAPRSVDDHTPESWSGSRLDGSSWRALIKAVANQEEQRRP